MSLSPQVKTSLLTAIFTIVLWYLLNAFIYHSWILNQGSAAKAQPFTSQGTGTATAAPDQAQVSFTVTKTAPQLQDAKNQANTETNTIVRDLGKLGIAKSDIQTSNYNSYPNYNTTPEGTANGAVMLPIQRTGQTILSYTVSENVNVTLKDNTKVNSAIDTITKDGAENISGPNYTFSDTTQKSLENKARINAINDAKEKAQSIADAAGIHLGRITSVQENNGGYPIQPLVMNSKASVSTEGSAPTQINPGENTVTINVTLYYETW